MFRKLRIKLFGRSRKELIKDIRFLCLEISYGLDDIREDLDDLHESVKESNKLILTIQEQCNEIISKMEKNNPKKEERTLDEILDNIERIIHMENDKSE
mgnify:CR=1 FL=1|jgi:hypothetical protein